MRIAVLGAGAMGSIYGACLSQSNEVFLIDRKEELVSYINRNGLMLSENGEERLFHPAAALSGSDIGKMDLVILFVKAPGSRPMLDMNRKIIGEDTILMTLQNGGGHERLLSQYASPSRIIIGTTEDNGGIISMGKVRHGGTGRTNIGMISPGPALGAVRDVLCQAGFDAVIHEDIERLIWHKLIINASLSVLTGILSCESSFIARDENAWHICRCLIKEIVETASSIGLEFSIGNETERVRKTSESQPGAYTSICMDIRNGRKTEVDTISGYVLDTALRNGVSVPYTDMAVKLIHALERQA